MGKTTELYSTRNACSMYKTSDSMYIHVQECADLRLYEVGQAHAASWLAFIAAQARGTP